MEAAETTNTWDNYFASRPLHSDFIPQQLNAAFSAAITLDDPVLLNWVIDSWRSHNFPRTTLYELTLQSYLFLGFPRMLHAAELLEQAWPNSEMIDRARVKVRDDYYKRGLALCQRVYGSAFEKLHAKVTSYSPEIAQWMVEEGYGKVLSRPDLDPISREISIVSILIVEPRPPQLRSHLRGAFLLGARHDELLAVIEFLGERSMGYDLAKQSLGELTKRA